MADQNSRDAQIKRLARLIFEERKNRDATNKGVLAEFIRMVRTSEGGTNSFVMTSLAGELVAERHHAAVETMSDITLMEKVREELAALPEIKEAELPAQ